MGQTELNSLLIQPNDLVLITGASGFIGSRLVQILLDRGFRNLRCFVRASSKVAHLKDIASGNNRARIELVRGNLLSRGDCEDATKNVAVIYHLAAARGEKSVPDAFMNSVVTTRNLMEAALLEKTLRRFVNVSSFAVYTNRQKRRGRVLDEASATENQPQTAGDAYCFAKVKQDEIVAEYGKRYGIPFVIVRPGYVYGPGNLGISGRVGINLFGLFLHLGGANPIPFTYVDNCAEAIALAGLTKGVDGEVFNVVDDELPSSREFLRLYKTNVGRFTSLYIPHVFSYALCYLWERYSVWSKGQLEPVYNCKKWHAYWKKTRYSNQKVKGSLGWAPTVSMAEGLRRYFQACRSTESNA
jgi:nucleoside-diphosphate-sugar epimerase